jgi:hypothetical protein
MAYVSQEKKKMLAPAIKKILKKAGLKGSLSVHHHSSLVLTISKGKIDFLTDYNKHTKENHRGPWDWTPATEAYFQVNEYHPENFFSEKIAKIMKELASALKGPDYFDDSDPMTDYFHCSHYIDIQVGKWNKPYVYEGA